MQRNLTINIINNQKSKTMETIAQNHKSTFLIVAIIAFIALMAIFFTSCSDKICPAYDPKIVVNHEKYK